MECSNMIMDKGWKSEKHDRAEKVQLYVLDNINNDRVMDLCSLVNKFQTIISISWVTQIIPSFKKRYTNKKY